MSAFKMNKHECRAAAAWANPEQEHDVASVSMNYVSQQLKIAAAADCEGPGAKLLNEESIPVQLQILADFRHCDQLLNLPTDPTTKDLRNLIDTIYQMDLFPFSEYYDFEKETPSDHDVEYLAGILLGKFCNNRELCLPKNISSGTLYYELDRLYNITMAIQRERDRRRTGCHPPTHSRWSQPVAPTRVSPPPYQSAVLPPSHGVTFPPVQKLQQRRGIWARAWACIKGF